MLVVASKFQIAREVVAALSLVAQRSLEKYCKDQCIQKKNEKIERKKGQSSNLSQADL